ncbi:glycosyltransferase family 2 protein [Riemerella anatipestifer]|nr:glycosyltransferase family 2 protein [Riemerella anatipestifer]MSN84116.1 glycosyltransferase family 2 protein [Riemerella anatipestifer]
MPFICVNYNSKEETLKYIDSVLSLQDSERAFVVVVDNSPQSDDYSELRDFIKNKELSNRVFIHKMENKGYFQGLNFGIHKAREINPSCRMMVVGNNDIVFDKKFLSILVDLPIEDKAMVLSPDVITNEGSHENPHVVNKIGFLRKLKYDLFYSHYIVGKILSKLKDINKRPFKAYDPERKKLHMGIGALYILTPNFFKHYEYLSEEVFLYGEEAILAGQVQAVGGEIWYEPSLVCHHNESSTTSKMASKAKYKIIQESYRIYRKYL